MTDLTLHVQRHLQSMKGWREFSSGNHEYLKLFKSKENH